MKIVVVGAAGTIGAAVTAALEANKHEVIRASRKLAPTIDIADPQSIRRFFAEVKDLDGVVSCAGDARFAPLDKLTDEDFLFSVNNKLMGQVNLIRAALPVIRDKGGWRSRRCNGPKPRQGAQGSRRRDRGKPCLRPS